MKIVFQAKDGKCFDDEIACKKYEDLLTEHIEYTEKRELDLFPPSEFVKLFNVGDIESMRVYERNSEDGRVTSNVYETYGLDPYGNLDCTDLHAGVLCWSNEDNCYYHTIYGRSWKVEVLGVKDVLYS